MNGALPNLRNRDAAAVVEPHSGVPRAERAASAAGRVRYHHQAISASSHLCWARCGVNFWLRGPRLTASCHWNVPECGTSGSSVDYANVLGGGWFGTFIVVLVLVFFLSSLCCGLVSVALNFFDWFSDQPISYEVDESFCLSIYVSSTHFFLQNNERVW